MAQLPELIIDGQGEETIVMVHGWPDGPDEWDPAVAHFSDRYRCVRFWLPGYDRNGPPASPTATGIVDTIAAVVDKVSPDQPVILFLHDWGCVHGYEYYMRNKQRVSKIVGVDIGNPRDLATALSAKEKVYIAGYQLALALAWKVGGAPGDWVSRRMARIIGSRRDPQDIHSGMGYPYWNTWFGRSNPENKIQPFLPECPTLFIYGRRKQAMFHTPQWLKWLKDQRPENDVKEFDTGHWIVTRAPDLFNRTVDEWLSRIEA